MTPRERLIEKHALVKTHGSISINGYLEEVFKRWARRFAKDEFWLLSINLPEDLRDLSLYRNWYRPEDNAPKMDAAFCKLYKRAPCKGGHFFEKRVAPSAIVGWVGGRRLCFFDDRRSR